MGTGISEGVRDQLEKILSSEGFSRNERLSAFLRFVVEQELSGGGDQLKESVIGVEVFGRQPGYDPRQDSVVRTEAAKLRARLAKYYESVRGPVVIELPKGTYRPVFREFASEPDPKQSLRFLNARVVWLAAATGFLIVAAFALSWWRFHRNAPIPIAVLPLINLSQDPSNDYFTDALTGELIRDLSIIDGLAVRSQTSSFVFKGKPQNIRDAGKQLNVEYILEGSVLRSGQQLRINTQFIRVRDDFPLWSGKYDREATDIFAIQDEISRGIVNSLRLRLGGGRRRYEASVEAYDLYLRGRAFEMQPALSGIERSVSPYEQAIAKDASFAPAYAGLALAYAGISGFDRFSEAERADQMSKMRAAAGKALQLDPLLAEAHAALGTAYARDAQWDQSRASFLRAIELDPGNSFLRSQFVLNLLLPLNRIAEAVAQLRLAVASDPLSPDLQRQLTQVLCSAGRFQEAARHCGSQCAEVLLAQGRADEVVRGLQGQAESAVLGRAYALVGRREEAEKIATGLRRPIGQAAILTALGDKDRAFEALERAIPLGPVRLGRALTYAEFAPLRGDPRLKALRKKVGLPD